MLMKEVNEINGFQNRLCDFGENGFFFALCEGVVETVTGLGIRTKMANFADMCPDKKKGFQQAKFFN